MLNPRIYNEHLQEDTSLSALLKLFAASKPGAKALQLGVATAPYGRAILDGLDMYSRLLAVVAYQNEEPEFQHLLDSDIRFAVHSQSFTTFLDDVGHHRFDMIVAGFSDVNETVFQLAESLLSVGGLMVLINEKNRVNKNCHDWLLRQISTENKLGNCFCSVLGDGTLIAVKLAENHRPSGGKRRENRLRRS